MAKVIPRTIIEKVGELSNLKRIVVKCLEVLYLDYSIIEMFTPSTVEHLLNGVISMIHDKEAILREYLYELKMQRWFSAEKLFVVKKTALHAILESNVEKKIGYRLVE